jgi:prepilin-type N-terminal cleavage/methylation domain-containing protein
MFAASRRDRAFSLIELVIVIVIIGIIGAIAIPRMSRGAAGAADGALTADLARLRNAVDLYQAEHNGTFPDLVTNQGTQLTQYTDENGVVASSKGAATAGGLTAIYGPYLRTIPTLPVGGNKGKAGFAAAAGGSLVGWVYVQASGAVNANCPDSETDVRGIKYNAY